MAQAEPHLDAVEPPREGAFRAAERDLVRLCELYEEATSALAESRGGTLLLAESSGAGGPDGAVAALLGDPNAFAASGWYEGALVGIGIARAPAPLGAEPQQPVAEHVPPVGRVELLYVEPLARGVGVGESLLISLVEWCAARGCTGVDVAALPGDRATKSLLERAGFVARKIVMYRPLSGA